MLLVIACPCALVISTPVAIVSALTVLARHGVLVKGGAHLETLGRLRAVAVDKTGTITEGKPRLLEIHCRADRTDEQLLEIAAAIEAHSMHPLARTIVGAARERGLIISKAGEYRNHNGRGAEGTVSGHRYFVGNHRFTHELGVCSHELEEQLDVLEGKGQSVVVIGHAPHGDCGGEVLGIFAIGDGVRPEGRAAVKALRDCGIERVAMLSGDNQRTVAAIAAQADITDARGDLLPEEKVRAVQELIGEFETVAMVGDGINDAPALATATLGIAMGAAGTDIAIETADVALMNDELNSVAIAIRMGRRALGIIRFNIAFAVGIKVVILVLALFGVASLWLAIFADTGATLIVIANSLRLLSFRWRLTRGGSGASV
jgi:Cd2+/Zn2+-exporting ATPase